MTERKIIPIKMERAIPAKYKTVEWKLHNVCNYDCSFAGTKIKLEIRGGTTSKFISML